MDIVTGKSDSNKPLDLLNTNKHTKDLLQERLEYYTSENKKLEHALKILRIIEDNGAINGQETARIVEKLTDVQEKFGVDKLNPTAMSMVLVENMCNSEDISGRLQKCLNIQGQISAKIAEKSKMASGALTDAEKQINSVNVEAEELQTLKSQLKKYDTEIAKYEERYPWLKDQSSDLLAIVGKTEDLKQFQYEEIKLQQELDQYKGLQPDLAEAHLQLMKLKEEYAKITSAMLNLL